jgi:hypothetical protein
MALIPQKTTDNKFVDPTVNQLSQGAWSVTDHGRLQNLSSSMASGLKNNITGVTSRWLRYKAEGLTGEKIEQEAYEKTAAPQLGIEYSGQTQNQLDYQITSKLQDKMLQDQAEGANRWMTNFTGHIAGGLLDPIGIAIPPAKANKVNLLLRAGHTGKATTVATASTFKNLLVTNTLLEAPYGAMKKDMGDSYTAEHLKQSLMFNPVFSGVFAGLRGYGVHKKGKAREHALNKSRAYTEFMNGQREQFDTNLAEATEVLQDAGSPAIKKIIDENPRLKDIAEGRVKDEDLTPEDVMNISAGLHMAEVGAKLDIMSAKLADDYLKALDDGAVIREAYTDYQKRVNRMSDAITTGDTSKLTPEDIQWLQDNANIFVRTDGADVKVPKNGTILEEGVGLSTKGSKEASYHRSQSSQDTVTSLTSGGMKLRMMTERMNKLIPIREYL